jgi:N utilization substance protein B
VARSTARKRALNTLYEADEKGQSILSLLHERLERPGADTPLPQYAQDIVEGVGIHRRQIDSIIDEHSTDWKVWRMAVIDRNILRIGVWEIVYNEEVPDKVAIDEALNLSKAYSEYDSPAFIHGVLGAVSSGKPYSEEYLEDPNHSPHIDEPSAQAGADQ